MTSNKKTGISLVAIVILGLVSSAFEPKILLPQIADSYSIVTEITQPTATQPENLGQALTSQTEHTQLDPFMLQTVLVLLFMTIKIAMVISFCLLVLMSLTSQPLLRGMRYKARFGSSSDCKYTANRMPFDNKPFS
ncbi:MAG: putative membrane protein [Paraglaciecola sp.]|jgi:uncharacterized membrane protein